MAAWGEGATAACRRSDLFTHTQAAIPSAAVDPRLHRGRAELVASGGLGLLNTASPYSRRIGRVLSCDPATASRQSPQRVLHLSAVPPAALGIVAGFRGEPSMTSFTITPLTDHTAAEVTGLDFTQPIDSETRAALVSAFAERHVLVMRDQQFTPSKFKAAAQLFGELQPHDKKERHVPGHPDVDYICNDEIVDGKRIIPGETFHTDHSNHPCPPKATTLFAVELPTRGGDTQYVNMHDAYDDLPDETKRKIDGLKAVHVYQSKYSPRSLGKITEESRRQLPPPGIHPLVCTHPENGRKALFLNPVRMESIIGMEDSDALALIDELMRHAPPSSNTNIATRGAPATGCCGITAASCTRPTRTTTCASAAISIASCSRARRRSDGRDEHHAKYQRCKGGRP